MGTTPSSLPRYAFCLLEQEAEMLKNHRQLFELERKKASDAGRVLREWQSRRPYLKRLADQEEAGQIDLVFGIERELDADYELDS